MDVFRSRPDTRTASARIRGWAVEVLGLGAEDTLTITELECTEPGCPPRETVLLVMPAGRPSWQHKIAKAADAVTREDLAPLAHHERGRSA